MEFLYRSPVGPLTIVSDGEYVTQIRFSAPVNPGQADKPIKAVCRYLDAYFSGDKPLLSSVPVKPKGTLFHLTIWKRLEAIPYGETVTYGHLAKEYAVDHSIDEMSAQAIGQAVKANPIPILIPCHRVIGSSGSLTGYSGGIQRKITLLKIERHQI